MSFDHVFGACVRVPSPPLRRSPLPVADPTRHPPEAQRCRHRGTRRHCSLMSPSTSPRHGCALKRRLRSGPPQVTHRRCSLQAHVVPGQRHRRVPQRRREQPRMPHQREVQRHLRRREPPAPRHPPRPPLLRLAWANRHPPPPRPQRPRSARPAPWQQLRLHRLQLRPQREASRHAPTRTPTGASHSPHSQAMDIARLRSRRAQASHGSTWSSPTRM